MELQSQFMSFSKLYFLIFTLDPLPPPLGGNLCNKTIIICFQSLSYRVWFWFTPVSSRDHYVLYGAMVLTGAGVATVLVTSLSMVADLIGFATVSNTKALHNREEDILPHSQVSTLSLPAHTHIHTYTHMLSFFKRIFFLVIFLY